MLTVLCMGGADVTGGFYRIEMLQLKISGLK